MTDQKIHQLDTNLIDADAFVRDRSVVDTDQLDELKISIRSNGQRLPIEVYAAENNRFALLSGYRRLMAIRDLAKLNSGQFTHINAIIRPATSAADTFAAMVEENEIRSNLSPYERGRIAVIATRHGAFDTVEGATNSLFAPASAAKRSKVRSLAEVFDSLGDMLQFPEVMTERRGLRLSAALRNGAEQRLRTALDTGQGITPDLEWALLEQIISETEAAPVKIAKMGRPKALPPKTWRHAHTLHLSSGVVLRREKTDTGHAIHVSGTAVGADLIDKAMDQLAHLFEAP